jgi:quercetin dioxygenase-like cupin family protein
MSSINRPLAGASLTFHLSEQLADVRGEEAYQRSGRAGRTLAKSGRLRVVLLAVADGMAIGTHQADSPMTLQVVQGALTFRSNGQEYTLTAGQVLFFGPGEAHDIRATEESALLLTVSATGDDYRPEELANAQASA